VVLIALALLVPGRILGHFWRDLLIGLRLLQERHFAQSARHSKKFLQDIDRRPWIQHLTWLGSGTYSRDARAMALNNLGAAEIFLGEFAAARNHLEQSSKLDGENPLPYFNMFQLEKILGNELFPTASITDARRIAETISAASSARGHPLVCRAVDAASP